MNFGGSLQEAVTLIRSGHMRAAVEDWERREETEVLKQRLLTLGQACIGLNLRGEGLELVLKALKLDEQDVLSLCAAGEALVDCLKLEQAVPCFLKATQIAPLHAPAWGGLGYLFLQQQKQKEALICLQKARELAPEDPLILNRLGLLFLQKREPREAIALFEESLRVLPDFAEAWSNLSVAWRQANDIPRAIVACEQALKIHPKNAASWTNLGVLFQELNALDEALFAYRQAISADKRFHLAHLNEGIALLLKGELSLGWLKYEYRWLLPSTKPFRHAGKPFWRGVEPLSGRALLLQSDQGFGDTIQCLRYVPILASMGALVHLEVEAPLAGLAREVAGVSSVTSLGDPLPPFDFHCPFLSLPLGCKTTLATIPTTFPYLNPSASAVSRWAHLGTSGGKLNVGLVWKGNPKHENNHNRSLALELLMPLLDCEFCSFFNLQWDLNTEESQLLQTRSNVQNRIAEVRDFDDTAALINRLDLVISADTAVAHLAGALGKPVWILLPFSPDWRWMLNRFDTPWYPSARLYRQTARGEWRPVIAEVLKQLKLLGEKIFN